MDANTQYEQHLRKITKDTPTMDGRVTQLEEQLAHAERLLSELSDVVAQQDLEIARLTRRVERLMQREAEREYDAGGSVPLADQKPPHW